MIKSYRFMILYTYIKNFNEMKFKTNILSKYSKKQNSINKYVLFIQKIIVGIKFLIKIFRLSIVTFSILFFAFEKLFRGKKKIIMI